jgi:phage-related protein
MAAKANNKMNISYTIKAIDRFTKTHEKLERQFSKLEDMTKGLTEVKEIKIDVDNAMANKQLERTKDKVEAIPKFNTIRLMVDGARKSINFADKFAEKLRTIEEIGQGMGRGGLGIFLPTLGPVLAVAAGGAGALSSALVGAGAAMGAFGMVAVPTIGYLKEIDKEVERGSDKWYELSAGTRDALTALDKLRGAWSKMQDTFREPVLNIFATNMDTARQALDLFEPTIAGAVDAVGRLSDKLQNSLGSADVKAIFEWLGNTSGKHLEDALTGVGNFAVGFGSLMKAFEPLTEEFMNGFVDMSESFRNWASTLDENQSFQNFLKFTSENGPLLLDFIGSLTTFVIELGKAMSPVGVKVLELANTFLKWSAEILKNHEGLGLLLGILTVAAGLFKVITPIILIAAGVFRTLWPVIKMVAGWIGKLWPVIKKVIPWVMRIGGAFLRFMVGPIGWVIQIVILLAAIIWKHWDQIKKWTVEKFGQIKDFIKDTWNKVKIYWEVIKDLAAILAKNFGEMVNSVRKKMGEIKDKIEDKWDDIKSFFSGIDLFSIGSDIIAGLVDGISSIDVWGAVVDVGSSIKSAFTKFFSIHSPSRLMKNDVGKWITLGVVDGMTSMASKAEREANMVANAIARPFQAMEKDYTFSAVGSARSQYSRALRDDMAVGTAAATVLQPQYKIVNTFTGEDVRTYINESNAVEDELRRFG